MAAWRGGPASACLSALSPSGLLERGRRCRLEALEIQDKTGRLTLPCSQAATELPRPGQCGLALG